MKWVEKAPRYGDVIRTKVSFYYHYGIYVSDERVIQFGLPDNVTRPACEIHVLSSDIGAFLRDGELEVAEPTHAEKRAMFCAEKIVSTAESRIGEGGYDILHNNCEHFVNECTFGEHLSPSFMNVRMKIRKKLGK